MVMMMQNVYYHWKTESQINDILINTVAHKVQQLKVRFYSVDDKIP